MPTSYNAAHLEKLTAAITTLRDQALSLEQAYGTEIQKIAPDYQNSARNLLHYLALRQHDLRELQHELTVAGVSSLGRSEAHVLASLSAVREILRRAQGNAPTTSTELLPPVDFATGAEVLAHHTESLLGGRGPGSAVRIMVTMPSEAATDYVLVRELVSAGMDVMRINCAHDDAAAWEAMTVHYQQARAELQHPGRVHVDLGGPKLRTGALEEGPHVVHWRPQRDSRGLVTVPARIWLTPSQNPTAPPSLADAVLLVDELLLRRTHPDDNLRVSDSRGNRPTLKIVAEVEGSRWAEAVQTAYVEAGALIELIRGQVHFGECRVGPLPPIVTPLILYPGDTLLLTPDDQLGRPAQRTPEGKVLAPARIPCALQGVFRDVRVNERIFFDDGKIGGVVKRTEPELIEVEITRARQTGVRLRPDKGINLPDTALRTPALTEKDLQDLDFAARHADMVGLSFVRSVEDVEELHRQLQQRTPRRVGTVLKIETQAAFENLPQLLLAGLQAPPLGVMVARGDLAVEMGFDRLAEVQEEILWLCEAAHVPVIWATQVLESLTKKGVPSRAEVTDAAMSGRAECVMLNKGPHVVQAVRFLNNVLERMQDHQQKKQSMLRKLEVSFLINADDQSPQL